MSIRFAHSIDLPQTPAQVFAVLDDLAQTPRWLERCTGIEKLTPGDNAVGTRLRYGYREGGRSGTMDGEITARTPGDHLCFRYADRMMEVIVDFRVVPTGPGARLTHTIDITPLTFAAKLFAPLIRRQLPKQTVAAMDGLRALLSPSS